MNHGSPRNSSVKSKLISCIGSVAKNISNNFSITHLIAKIWAWHLRVMIISRPHGAWVWPDRTWYSRRNRIPVRRSVPPPSGRTAQNPAWSPRSERSSRWNSLCDRCLVHLGQHRYDIGFSTDGYFSQKFCDETFGSVFFLETKPAMNANQTFALKNWMYTSDQFECPILSSFNSWIQWRIQDFPDGGSNPKGRANLLFGLISPKTAWKWRKLDQDFTL